ncbi:MAG: zincin-like metallopeptidase domain-containing protein [Sphingomicrobium sp.]
MCHDGTMRASRESAAKGRARGRKGSRAGRSGGSGGPNARRSGAGRSEAGTSGTGGEQPRVSLYAEVTARIIAELEAGRFPWVQPWSSTTAAPGLPCNAVTGRRYSGINILLLWGAVIERSYASQGWLTFRQALDAGGCVRKGERGVAVVYGDRFTPENERERARSDGDDPRTIPFLKRFTLFNIDQCDGLPERLAVAAPPLPERETMPVAEALITATGADFRIGGAKAFYAPGADYVQVPPQPAFDHQIDYYRTALHELGHWTGHPSRLGRDQSHPFGSADYAREELCAELASAYLCAALGIFPTVRHADYLASWLEVLRADPRAIFRAASHASRAADYLLAFQPDAQHDNQAALAVPAHVEAERMALAS